MRSATTMFSGGAARVSWPESRSTPICPWAILHACPAVSAWCRAPPALSPTRASCKRCCPASPWTLTNYSSSTISRRFLELNKNAVVRRHFRQGEIVCCEGEYGSTAFYIVEGQAEVYLSTPMAHVNTKRHGSGFLGKMTSRLFGRQQERRSEEGHRDTIPIDAPVDLPYDHPVATLGPGDLFGEMTCISLYPRSATVMAATDCVMFEMLRNVLDIIQRNKTLRAQLDAKYRQRALDDHLRSVPMFASLTQEFIDVLRNKVELVRYTKGDVICSQGDVADSFYLIRLGFAKVSEPHPGGDLVLAYLGRGGYFGEIGLLGGGI